MNSRLRIESEVLLQSNSSPILHLKSTTLNTEIKKKRSKSRLKSVLFNNELRSYISDSILTNISIAKQWLSESIEKISSEDLDALYEKEARRNEKNKAKMTRLLATT